MRDAEKCVTTMRGSPGRSGHCAVDAADAARVLYSCPDAAEWKMSRDRPAAGPEALAESARWRVTLTGTLATPRVCHYFTIDQTMAKGLRLVHPGAAPPKQESCYD